MISFLSDSNMRSCAKNILALTPLFLHQRVPVSTVAPSCDSTSSATSGSENIAGRGGVAGASRRQIGRGARTADSGGDHRTQQIDSDRTRTATALSESRLSKQRFSLSPPPLYCGCSCLGELHSQIE